MAAFVAVADLKGFSPAARRLKLSAPAVTRLIAGLEQHLGARLLQRTTRSVALTDTGARYLPRARAILAEVAEADASIQAERARPGGTLVVSAPVGFGRLHVTPVMSAYLRTYPDVVGELRLEDRVVSLVEDGIDCAVRIGPLVDSSVVARAVGQIRRIVVASPDYLARRGTPTAPADLAAHDTIQFDAASASPDWRFVVDGRDMLATSTPRFQTNSADAAIWHAEQGGGLTRVLAYQAAAGLAAGRLQVVLTDYQPPPVPIHLVYPTQRLLSAKVRAFVDLVVATTDWQFGAAP